MCKDRTVSNIYFNQGVNPKADKFSSEVKSFGLHPFKTQLELDAMSHKEALEALNEGSSLYYVGIEMVIDGSVCSVQLPTKKRRKEMRWQGKIQLKI
jgi:hypothetical protein